jgi:uncharacterized protein (DUF362 family)
VKGARIVKQRSIISLVNTSDRASGIPAAINLLRIDTLQGKNVLLKPNFNTADPFPGSTHNDTLSNLIMQLKKMSAKTVIVGDRSGPTETSEVIREKAVDRLCRDHGADLVNFEDLQQDQWARIKPEGCHWRAGFDIAQPVLEAGAVVTTCCLKTHGYGAVFTMSLKLSVGMVHRHNMGELHSSSLNMRKMVAEINQAYAPALIVLDGIEAFTDQGPMTGTRKRADVILAGTDRVAIDAVGIAVLKHLGSNKAIMDKKIFEQEQIAHAVELKLGASTPDEIEIVTSDDNPCGVSRSFAPFQM